MGQLEGMEGSINGLEKLMEQLEELEERVEQLEDLESCKRGLEERGELEQRCWHMEKVGLDEATAGTFLMTYNVFKLVVSNPHYPTGEACGLRCRRLLHCGHPPPPLSLLLALHLHSLHLALYLALHLALHSCVHSLHHCLDSLPPAPPLRQFFLLLLYLSI